ncbi:XRE family transcriptional regulator [Clostridium beijerinckii]|nr:XRE family transcriptional regulator [Clostridium beijerinckii]
MYNLGKILTDTLENLKWYERIKRLRKFHDWSIKKAADKCITTQKAWWNWENGKVIPTKRNRKLIASIFGVDMKIIFGEISLF